MIRLQTIKKFLSKMSCDCQYIAPEQYRPQKLLPIKETGADTNITEDAADNTDQQYSDAENPVAEIMVCATELSNIRSENWMLKKKLHECDISIQSLEQVISTLMDKQRKMLGEMFELRKENKELSTECRLQRDYHMMERNALIKELHDSQTLLGYRTRALDYISGQTELKAICYEESEDSDDQTSTQHELYEEDDEVAEQTTNSESEEESLSSCSASESSTHSDSTDTDSEDIDTSDENESEKSSTNNTTSESGSD